MRTSEQLAQLNIDYRTDLSLAELSTFKVGGPADIVFYPDTVEQCAALIHWAKTCGEELIFLGNGSNVLGSDKGCRACILKTDRLCGLELLDGRVIRVGAGVRTVKVSSFAAKNALSGLEFLYGIPGTVGGAVFMNAGAYDGCMEQVVLRTRYLDSDGNLCVLEKDQHDFGYRKSFFMQHPEYLIVETELQLSHGVTEQILAKIDDLQQRRKDKQPLEYPSAGSTFKRPEGYFAGKLIQDAGLRGFSVGGAQVSEKHCGFVINKGGATGTDVRRLIEIVKDKVKDRFGVDLECEVRYLGEE